MKNYAKYYDLIYLKKKDYKEEAEKIARIIRKFNKNARTLLDVGCGTAEHLKYLSKHFDCWGIDINPWMIKIAKKKVPKAQFKVMDMVRMRLEREFDVIISLFSSIGYVRTRRNLEKAFRNFYRHLNENGILLIEPWIFVSDFKEGKIIVDFYEGEKLKLVRMAKSRLTKNAWVIEFHYLIGRGGEIRYEREVHRLIKANKEDYEKSLKAVGFRKVRFLKKGLWKNSRGLFLSFK